MKCRHCGEQLSLQFVDLGSSPPSNSYLSKDGLFAAETYFPLRVLICEKCWLVQTEDTASREEFFNSDYAYFSSYSATWLKHAEQYVNSMVNRFGLTAESTVVEIASNDGYLLQYVKDKGIGCYGVEPTKSTAEIAKQKGIRTIEEFFGVTTATHLHKSGNSADLMAANNVLAHVPDINDFVSGFRILLKPDGVATFEFPHLLNLIEQKQFDTIYHEHFSYLSLSSVKAIFETNGLQIFDIEELPTHGGSLRVFAQRADKGTQPVQSAVSAMLEKEISAGLQTRKYYEGFQNKVNKVKNDLLKFLIDCYEKGLKVAAYGAAAKGNTLLNYAGIRQDLISYVVDQNPAKQNKFLPASRIPIVNESFLKENQPAYVIILPWNLSEEIMQQISYIRSWNAKFVVAIPELKIF